MTKHLFGPVPSRRLGVSLGIDLVPLKLCTLDCIYCECGPTDKLAVARREYISYSEVTAELDEYMNNNPEPDYITFSGSGEPTLNSRIGDILNYIKTNYPSIPVAVLTNGTLFNDPQVRREILKADLVLPSLDAASEECFRLINRPHKSLSAARHIEGLKNFRQEYEGKIWLEVFIAPGINDNSEEINLLKNAISDIKPDSVQLNTLDRPGAIEGLMPCSAQCLQNIADTIDFPGTEIIAAPDSRKKTTSYSGNKEEIILETIERRPCSLEDISFLTGLHINDINKYLAVLENAEKVETVREGRGIFYRIKRK